MYLWVPVSSDQNGREDRIRLLEAIVTAANDAIIVTETAPLEEPVPRIVYVNHAFVKMTGYQATEVVGRNPRFLQGPDTDSETTAQIRATLEREESFCGELLNYRKDGRGFWVEISIFPVRNAAGTLTYRAAVQRDVTDRHETEALARKLGREEAAHAEASGARKRLELILESITDGFVAIDCDLRFTYVNQRAAKYLGRSREHVIGKRLPEEISQAWLSDFEEQVRSVLKEKESRRFEEYHEHTNSWFETRIHPTEEGATVYSRDITASKRAEQALRESETKFSGIVNIAADAIISVDETQNIVVFNRGAEDIFGYTADEIMGKSLDILIPEAVRTIHRQHVESFGKTERRVRRMGERGAVSGRRKNGEIFPAEASISKITLRGRPLYTAVLRDVTATIRAEQPLQEANENLSALIQSSALMKNGRFVLAKNDQHKNTFWRSLARANDRIGLYEHHPHARRRAR